ncbi:hypothetical protein [Georgenia sp. SUBG003]|uniref:hypothetical protein n=1 Tax=Georgenia sp. SUBG003 TaxID=1497974 RepID=UPI003AB27CED
MIDGWSEEVPGNEVLEFDPEKAKELWAEAEASSPGATAPSPSPPTPTPTTSRGWTR